MRILLARHGETAWNIEGRYQGRDFDIPLAESGIQQAQALGSRLSDLPLTRAVSSPLLRARQTAEIVLGSRKSMLRLDARLEEFSYGSWEGRLDAEIWAEEPELRQRWRDHPHHVLLPGGESFQDVLDRAWSAFCEACGGLDKEETVFIVSHDGVNRVILCHILGLPLARIWAFRQAACSINLLEGSDPEHLSLVRLNDASHCTPLFGEAVHRR